MQWEACVADVGCICMVECLGMGGSGFDCGLQCGGVTPATTALFMCRSSQCMGVC
jgi:hypothetical protein